MAFDLFDKASQVLMMAGTRAASAALDISKNVEKNVEPQHAYRWEVHVKGVLGNHKAITFYAQNTAIPEKRKDPVKIRYCGTSFTYQGRSSGEKTLSVRFYDNQSLDIYHFFYQWMDLMNAGREDASVDPINYMKQMEIRLLDTTDSIITEQFFFEDSFPIGISEVSLDYSASEVMGFDVTFAFNDMGVGYDLTDAFDDISNTVSGIRSLF